MDKRENKRNWYLQIQAAFFDDSDYKRFRRRLPQDVQDGTAIYLKMILLAIKDGETKNAEDVTLSFFHDEDSFSEEIAYAINEDPMEVKAVIDTMLKCHILEEVQPDTWQIHFPDGTIGSITDSSLRSRKSREKRRMLQCNTNATQEQHESNLYNSNRNNNSNSQIDSNNHINLTVTETDTETENSASGFDSAEGGPAVASAAGAAPRPAPDSDLFTLDQLKRCIKKNKVDLTDEGAAAFLDEMHESGWILYGRPVEKNAIVRALRAWAKYHGEYSAADPEDQEEEARAAEKEKKLRQRKEEDREKAEQFSGFVKMARSVSCRKGDNIRMTIPYHLRNSMIRDGIPEYAVMAFSKMIGKQYASTKVEDYDPEYIAYLIDNWNFVRDTIWKYAEVAGVEF